MTAGLTRRGLEGRRRPKGGVDDIPLQGTLARATFLRVQPVYMLFEDHYNLEDQGLINSRWFVTIVRDKVVRILISKCLALLIDKGHIFTAVSFV